MLPLNLPTPKHSEHFLKMVKRRDRYGELENADGYGKRHGDCGDTIEMFLRVEAGRVKSVFFRVDGCGHTIAAANTVSFLTEGHSLVEAWDITPEQVIDYLESMPPDHFHCAELAVGALYNALTDFGVKHPEEKQEHC